MSNVGQIRELTKLIFTKAEAKHIIIEVVSSQKSPKGVYHRHDTINFLTPAFLGYFKVIIQIVFWHGILEAENINRVWE